MSRQPAIEEELTRILSDLSGLAREEMSSDATFLDQGLDSLSLTQATLEFERAFGIKLRFRRLLEDLDTIRKLSVFLDTEMPADKFAAPKVASVMPAAPSTPTPMSVPAMPMAMAADGSLLQQVIAQQMQLMSQQLALLSGQPATMAVVAAPPKPAAPVVASEPEAPSSKALLEKPFGASARISLDKHQDFTPAQRRWLDDFITRYVARSGSSKTFSQQHRLVMADPRVVTGFNPLWKDLVYPIVANRSDGARLWDIDGNEYIDLLSCFGANLLGYQPKAVVQAMAEQLERGIEVGPQHPLAAEVAELISQATGMERVAFCNTGSEAVMGAMRVARTVTGRKTIAIFSNSYHGIFDEVIVRGTKQLRSISAAPGILANAVEHILVLDWASEESLKVLRERGHELAAIMTEPIQNKYPTVQPREFLHALRQIATDNGCALIFDEVVTGFRVAPGGAQEFYGVRADICTYGKIIGGGLPFAAMAGASHWLDALDGGHWQYGDDSYPEAGVTYFAGTFVRHPLALAAARATLQHLKRGGRALYQSINDRTQRLIDKLNTAFAARGAPCKAVHCASLWRLQWDDGQRYVSLFYYLLRFHGLHCYEQFGHFVTEAMTEADTQRIFEVITKSLDELMALGFILPRDGTPPSGGKPDASAASPSATPAAGSATALQGQAGTQASLTPGQSERWLAAAFDDHARRALNESFYVTLQGTVNVDALKAALQDVLQRHEAFRISFDQDEPMQRLGPAAPIPVAEIDLSQHADAASALDAFCTEASRHDFDLSKAPLAAVSLLQLSDGRVAVHLVASHLVFDGWASSVFNADLRDAYNARCQRRAPSWAQAAASPLQFARDEEAAFAGPEGQAALAYWRGVMTKPPPPLALGDLAPAKPRRYAANTVHLRLDAALTTSIRQHAKASKATLFQWLLAGVTLLLQRRAKQTDLVISVPYASQGLGDHGPLLADGVLDLPLRLRCEPHTTFGDLLLHVRSQVMDALDAPRMTQGTLARAMGLRSLGDRPPLSAIFFNLNPKVDVSGYEGLAATFQEGRKQGTLNDLFFNFYDQGETLSFDLHHSADLFSPALAQSLVDEMLALYQQAAGGNAAPIGQWPAAAPVAIDPRLAAWNATDRPLQARPRLERWISAQAARTPDRVAVVAGAQQLTYRHIEQASNRIANLLLARGVGQGDLVGICLSRGAHLLPALLGVLKTGAAYVPLDPHFPVERLHYMAQDAQLKLAITEAAHADKCGVGHDAQLRVDDDTALIQAASTDAPHASSQWPANAPAYVIYTSGSTGQPKGVALPQDAVCNFLASMRDVPGLAENDKLLAVTTLSFDIAVLELYLPLTLGACVVLATRDDIMDGEVLSRKLADEHITVLQATPTTWHLLLDAGWRAPKGFKALCGGEALPPALAKALLEHNIELWNMYGPTETTVWSTCCRITDGAQKISIGTPIANTQVWIVDEQLRPVPAGSEGEICIGGRGVALGYFKRPELTAEKFVADPFSPTPGARLYRTGDLGRWRDDGQLEHLGRMDFQVKVRGYRIELGEIEAACTAFEGVAQAIVTAPELSPGNVQLVAYVVPKAGGAPDHQALRAQLKLVLPDYMVPQQVVSLASLPLLPNGKVNRKALPLPELGSAAPAPGASAPPANEAEAKVLDAMRAVLNQPGLGVTDNFFDMGGHSLAAARLATRLRKAFDATLPIRTIFESPTARALAAAFANLAASQMVQRAPVLHDPQRTQAPLTPMQARIRFMESMQPGRVVYNTPSAHRLRGPMNVPLFQQAFALLVQRQSTLRTYIAQAEDGSHVQRVADTVAFEWPLQDLSHLPPTEREAELTRRLRAELDTPIEITEAPLFRVALYRLADDDHGFLFMPHHIIWDGWSFDLLYEEMAALYGALLRGQTPQLALPPVTYGDYAAWYADWLQSDEAKKELDYWRQRFVAAPVPRPLSTDRPRKAGMSGVGGAQFVHIDHATTEKLRAVATAAGATLNMLTLTVYAAMMSDATDGEHIVVGSPLRGRLAPEIEQVMGFFNNMLPMHLRLPRSARLSDAMRQVKADLMDVFSHQSIPFEVLAADPAIGRRLQHSGLYQVMFSFQDARERQRDWGGLQQQSILIFQRGATEDMGLWMMDVPKGMEGGFIYNTDVYDDSTAEALRACYLDMLHHIAEHGHTTIAELCALEQSQRSGASDVLRRLKPQLAAVAPSGAAAPSKHWTRSEDEQSLAAIWADLLDLDAQTIQAEQSFFDLGGNSLLAMSLVAEIHRRLNVRLAEAVIMDSPTLPALARALRAPPKSTSLVTVRTGAPADHKPPVFLIHDADGQVLLYRNLAYRLDEGRAVHGLQPLVDEHGLPVHTRIEDMARHYVTQIKAQQPSGPYAVGGLCAGGVIAFEVALQLQRQGDAVGLVALIDAVDVAVSESSVKVAKERLKKLTAALAGHADLPLPQRLIASASTLARKAKSYLSYELQRHNDQAQKASQVQALRQQRDDATSSATATTPPLDRVTLRTVYNDAATIYTQSAKLAAPVLLLRATQGSGDAADRPMIEMVSDPTLGWQRHVQGRIDCVDVAGGHATILQQPHVEEVALAMQRHLDRMGSRSAQPVAA
jgi:amino acid adenylation domain-containing protein